MKLWINGHFHTMEEPGKVYHTMLTHRGLIVGFDPSAYDASYDEIIDLKGGHVYPGFVDAHMHLMGYGQMLSRPNLSDIDNKEDVIDIIVKNFKQEALFCQGYKACGLTKHDLNRISDQYPIYVRHNDYHSITVNDAVLRLMGLSHPTGILTEAQADQAIKTYPRYTKEGLETLFSTALKSLYAFGITGAHSDDLYYFNGFHETLEAFESVLKKHPFRTHLLMHHMELEGYIQSKRSFLDQSKYLQLGAVKMFYDGTISSKTAWMKDSYKHSNNHGEVVNTKAGFIRLVKEARRHQLPVAVHVIGDQGLMDVIEILETYPPLHGTKDRLIHTPWAMRSSIDRLAKLELSVDIQPQFLSSDLPWALDFFSKTPELCFPWKTMMDAGINLAGSSDAPVEIPNPLLGIHAATKRQSRHDHKIYFEEEAISRFEAIKLYTTYAQYNTKKANRGWLKPGFIADLTVFDHDLETMDHALFLDNILRMTVIDEQIVYQK